MSIFIIANYSHTPAKPARVRQQRTGTERRSFAEKMRQEALTLPPDMIDGVAELFLRPRPLTKRRAGD